MKTNLLSLTKFLFLPLIAITLFSCSDDGKDGAIGPAGTANVIYSEWLPLPNYTSMTYEGAPAYSYSFPSPDFTEAIVNHGLVLAYLKSGDKVIAVPATITGDFTVATLLYVGDFRIITYQANGPAWAINNTSKARYVIIPGGIPTQTVIGKSATPDYKNMSYEQVCKLLNIPM